MSETFKTGDIIDQHRIAHVWSGKNGRTIECLCGHKSQALYEDQITPITDENNPERVTQRAHADHVALKVEEHLEDPRWLEEIQRQKVERMGPLGAPGVIFRAVERTSATKYQVQAFDREYPEKVVADLLRRAANEIAKHEEIPTQIKIDRAPVGQGEKITVTWFA